MNSVGNERLIQCVKSQLAPRIRRGIRCAIVYGSRATADSSRSPQADVDIFLVTKRKVNPVDIIEKVVGFFDKLNLRSDPFWYVEDYFLRMLECKRDLSLWHNIFLAGQIIYGDEEIIQSVFDTLNVTSPCESFRSTITYRQANSHELLFSTVRNLDRILTEAIWLVYYRANGLSSWEQLPDYKTIAEKAFAEGLISDRISSIASRLSVLKKGTGQVFEQTTIQFLAEIENDVNDFAIIAKE